MASRNAEDAEVLLVHRPKYDDWSLPKGKCEPDEHILLTAVREVWEETCVRPVLGPRLPTVEYISWGRPKRVSYWSAFGGGHEAAPGNEIDAVAWLPLARARELLAATHDDPVVSALRPRRDGAADPGQARLGRAQGGLAGFGRRRGRWTARAWPTRARWPACWPASRPPPG